MDLPGRVMESQGHGRHDRNRVLPVVHVRHSSSQLAIDKIGECLVPDARHAVADHLHCDIFGEPQAEENAIEQGKRRTQRMADDGHG